MTVLIIGATGTLGRQIARSALDQGYSVKCMVRNIRKAAFLREWGAELVYGDLSLPETLPTVFTNVSVVIDAATFRTDDEKSSLLKVDLLGKLALIKSAKTANIERFIFFSFPSAKTSSIPLLVLKNKVEKILVDSGLPYTIFYLSGFYQGLISQYAVPILDQQEVWLTNEKDPVSYINSQDAARLCVSSLAFTDLANHTYSIKGKTAWFSKDIVNLCEQLSGQKGKIRYIPIWALSILRQLFGFSKWGWPVQDRLAFSEALNISNQKPLNTDNLVSFPPLSSLEEELLPLETYLQEYFEKILDKLRDLNYDTEQALKRKDLLF